MSGDTGAGFLAQYSVLRSVFELASEGIVVTDADNRILAANPAFTRITGYTEAEALGRAPDLLRSGHQTDSFYAEMRDKLTRDGRWEGELWNRRKSGEIYRQWLSISADRLPDGRILRHVGIFRDVTQASEATERLWQSSNYDPLTGLPNRGLFLDRLLQALVMADREGRKVALLFLGLDGFRHINDTLGHTLGDYVLSETGRRLSGALRAGDTLSRFGGDEFTVALADVRTIDEVEAVVRGLLECLNEPFLVEGHRVLLSCSIGACLWPGDGEDVDALMRNASSAMRSAKNAGRNTFRFFTPAMDARAQARARLAGELSDALGNEEFHLVYQPIIHLATGRVAGAEALLRWDNRYVGAVNPDEFVTLAEEMGLIVPIGDWLLIRACREAVEWQALSPDPVRLAVNVSARQVARADITGALERAVDASGIDPSLITIEITESLLLDSAEEVLAKLDRVRALGARIAVDDFGTGYASLSYLKHFPVDILKIDRTFVADAHDNPEDARLVEAIIALGHSLGMEVVGEGVETLDQLTFLMERGCDYVQGYRFSPPLSAARFRDFIPSRISHVD